MAQNYKIGNGLDLLQSLQPKSVTLIILDLPYYGVVDNDWDNQWKNLDEYLDWCKEWFIKSERCLKDNGTLYYFNSQFKVIKAIDTLIESSTKLKFRQFITIDKGLQSVAGRVSEALRSYPKASEYFTFYTFEDSTGWDRINFDANNYTTLRQYFKWFMDNLGMTKSEIVNLIGQEADHCFRWDSSQWLLPTKETYQKLLKLPFMRREYEELRYPFNSISGFTDTWSFDFYKEQRYNHPTQKPFSLIERIVLTSSNKDDLVVDPCMGTGTTLKVCKIHNRNFEGAEINSEYEKIIRKRCDLDIPKIKITYKNTVSI